MCSRDFEAQKSDPYLYSIKMADEIMSQLPATAVFTSEFDCFRRCSTNFARRLLSHSKLKEFVVHPGLNHPSGMHLTNDSHYSKLFWNDLATVVQEHS
jgi:acetyl esterase/lipase